MRLEMRGKWKARWPLFDGTVNGEAYYGEIGDHMGEITLYNCFLLILGGGYEKVCFCECHLIMRESNYVLIIFSFRKCYFLHALKHFFRVTELDMSLICFHFIALLLLCPSVLLLGYEL